MRKLACSLSRHGKRPGRVLGAVGISTMTNKPKSVGTLRYPFFEVEAHSARAGTVVVTIKDGHKKLKIEGSAYFVCRQLIRCARLIAAKEVEGAAMILDEAQRLQKMTGSDAL